MFNRTLIGFNPSKIYTIFGVPGSGKTTLASAIAYQYTHKKKFSGIGVYTNFHCTCATYVDTSEIGHFQPSEKCAVFIVDEAGIDYDNRNFKNGLFSDKEVLKFWKLHRHYRCMFIVLSQGYEDCDKKIRDMSDSFYRVSRCLIPGLFKIRRINQRFDIDEETHQPANLYDWDVFLNTKRFFGPKYRKFFNSFEVPPLPSLSDYRESQKKAKAGSSSPAVGNRYLTADH